MRVLLPIDRQSRASKLIELSHMFSEKENTKFYAFFADQDGDDHDHLLRKSKKEDARLLWQSEAKRLHLDFEFVKKSSSHTAGLFADLLMVESPSDQALNIVKANAPESIGCAVCVACDTLQAVDEIFILVAHDLSVAMALKSFANFFPAILKNKKITIVTDIASNHEEIVFEQGVVGFVKEYSDNAGIIPASKGNGYSLLLKLASEVKHPLLIMGRSIHHLLKPKEIDQRKSEDFSLYYYN